MAARVLRPLCPICQRHRCKKDAETCGYRCAAVLIRRRYGADMFREAGRAGRHASQVKSAELRRARFSTEFPAVPLNDAQALYRWGYHSGYNRRDMSMARSIAKIKAVAFDAGYRQAQLDALKGRRSA